MAGRLFDLYLPPLQFPEFLDFKGFEPTVRELYLDAFERTVVNWERTGTLEEFLLKGGFPEIPEEEERGIMRRYVVNSCIEKIVFEDLPGAFDIKNRRALFGLWNVITRNPGDIFMANNLTDVVGISRNTVNRYLFYLQKVF